MREGTCNFFYKTVDGDDHNSETLDKHRPASIQYGKHNLIVKYRLIPYFKGCVASGVTLKCFSTDSIM